MREFLMYYGKGFTVSALTVIVFYLLLQYTPTFAYLKLFWFMVTLPFRDPNAKLGAVAGGYPSVLMYVEFWLWSMIVFASTFLIYLRLTRGF
jgi:hypothetical protein